jgi:SAM-dependent methyltransferase
LIIAPPPVTWRACRAIAGEGETLLRSLENNAVRALSLQGSTLDVGGGKGFGYVAFLKLDGQLVSANIAPEVQPDFLVDFNRPLPMADATYDNVVSFNTLEHVYQDRQLLVEMMRVLKPGGTFVLSVPFLYRRHGNYGDFHRHTADYWEQVLCDCGLRSADFTVQPLVWSPLASALTSMRWFRGGIAGRAIKFLVMGAELLRPGGKAGERRRAGYRDWALSFFIRGVRTAIHEAR